MAEKERALALRYRHVKFFDRRKAMRRLKTAQRLQKEAEASGAAPADGRSMDELTADWDPRGRPALREGALCVH